MPPGHDAGEVRWEGYPAYALRSPAGLRAVFAPGVGMVGCSLTHDGEELLGRRGGLARYASTGSTFGIPLLHPWANRLSGLRYAVEGREVLLDAAAHPIRLDPHGLPIHGLLAASTHWQLTGAGADAQAARLSARLDFGAVPELLAAFPFPHELRVSVRLAELELTIETTLRPTADVAVPIAFGFHPYLRLPDPPRRSWEVTMPVRRRAILDARGIPTGRSEPARVAAGALGAQTFDDLFDELAHPKVFALAGGGRRLELSFGDGYDFAQVYAPPGEEFICFEPMTAPTNALVAGGPALRLAAPGEEFSASFSIAIAGR